MLAVGGRIPRLPATRDLAPSPRTALSPRPGDQGLAGLALAGTQIRSSSPRKEPCTSTEVSETTVACRWELSSPARLAWAVAVPGPDVGEPGCVGQARDGRVAAGREKDALTADQRRALFRSGPWRFCAYLMTARHHLPARAEAWVVVATDRAAPVDARRWQMDLLIPEAAMLAVDVRCGTLRPVGGGRSPPWKVGGCWNRLTRSDVPAGLPWVECSMAAG